jgi:hypothetical protein
MFAVTSFSMPRKSGGFGGVAGSLMDYVISRYTIFHQYKRRVLFQARQTWRGQLWDLKIAACHKS